jgi:hypothetical protein
MDRPINFVSEEISMSTRGLAIVLVSAAVTLLLGGGQGEAAPLRPRVARCTPNLDPDSQGGYGGTADSRRVGIDFGLFTEPADDAQAKTALADTTRIEVCWVRAGGAGNPAFGDCPGDSGVLAWVVFDDVDKPLALGGKIKTKGDLEAWILPSTGKGALPEQIVQVPMDWGGAANAGTFFFLRVNKEAVDFAALGASPMLTAGGFCPILEPMAAGGDPAHGIFNVYGTPTTIADPFGGAFAKLCEDGNKAGTFDAKSCSDQPTAQLLADRMPAVSSWQADVAMARMTTPLDPPMWANGKCGAGFCPTLVRAFSSDGASHGGLGFFTLWGMTGVPAPPLQGTGGYLRIISHELWHNFQSAWGRAKGGIIDGQLWTEPFLESTPAALESNLCFFGYPGVDAGQCVSGRKLGYDTGIGNRNVWLDGPHNDLLAFPYAGELFWRYAMEQLALPVDPASPAHPAGESSLFPNPGAAIPLGDPARRSDEGSDLLGQVVEAFLAAPQTPALDAIDKALRDELGRGLDAVLLDLHTAALLKDYTVTDERWRFEWVGDYNAGAADHFACAAYPAGACPFAPPAPPLAAIKAAAGGRFPVQPDLASPAPASDLLHRAHRLLDVYAPCPGCAAPTPVPFTAGRSEASPQEVYMAPFSAVYLSAAPDPGLGTLRVRLRATKGTHPRFRIFLVKPDGTAALYAACAVDADGAAPADTERCQPDLNGLVDAMIPIDAQVAEVLVAASAGREAARFTWVIGADSPHVAILDPTPGHPAQIGHPGPPDANRPLLVQLAVSDDAGEPLTAVAPGDVHLRVPGCSPASGKAPGCELSYPADFQVAQVGSGLYWVLAEIPDDFYPAAGTKLDLVARIENLAPAPIEDGKLQALVVDAAPEVVTQVVLDRSGSMADFKGAKWKAATVATQLLMDAVPDGERFGIVTFNQDAATPYPLTKLDAAERAKVQGILAGLVPGGWTSVGDGALEAQANLIAAGFDMPPVPPAASPVFQTIVLSDGMSNADYVPRRYYQWDLDQGTADAPGLPAGGTDNDPADNAPWATGATGKLSYPVRKSLNALVPMVSTVAIGEDAEPDELISMADACGGTFSSIDGVTQDQQFLKITVDMSDAFRQAMDKATGHERTLAVAAPDFTALPGIAVEPQSRELLVSVASGLGGAGELRLVSPGGQALAPVASSGTSAVFRVAAPEAGTWHWLQQVIKPIVAKPIVAAQAAAADKAVVGGPAVFVEAAVQSPIHLIAHAAIGSLEKPPLPGEPWDSGRWAGRPVFLRAALTDGAPVLGAQVSAEVTTPAGNLVAFALTDDGQHADGAAGDGFYGAAFQDTNTPGVYRVRLVATGTSAQTGGAFRRERTLAVALHAGPDSDGDGLPDWWETASGTDPAGADGQGDPDGDGLDNLAELAHHTLPWVSDSDGGGEADGSEIGAGRDPLASGDDALRPFVPTLVPGNGKGLVRVPAPAGLEVEVECAPDRDGPYVSVALQATPAGDRAFPLANGEPACCRTRTVNPAAGAASAWSAPQCVTPRTDPFPPTLRLEPATGRTWTPTRAVRVRLMAGDMPETHSGALQPDPAALATGVKDMLVATRADFAGAAWKPFAPEVDFWLGEEAGGTVWGKVRDGAGNESHAASLTFKIAARTPLDAAIGPEEHALDLMKMKKWGSARKEIRASRPQVRESLHTVKARIAQAGSQADSVDRRLLRGLRRVRCHKRWALWLAHRPFGGCARHHLEKALALERKLAAEALAEGRAL